MKIPRGDPPLLWQPQTIDDLRRLAKRIEKNMLKEETASVIKNPQLTRLL
jgi:hypothetical protein